MGWTRAAFIVKLVQCGRSKKSINYVFMTDSRLMQVQSSAPEHSAIRWTCNKLPYVFKIVVLSIFTVCGDKCVPLYFLSSADQSVKFKLVALQVVNFWILQFE